MEGLRTTMLTLLAAVAFVLLIACVNVANLLLARGAARQKGVCHPARAGRGGMAASRASCLPRVCCWRSRAERPGCCWPAGARGCCFYVFKMDALHLPLRPVDSIPLDGRVFAFALARFLRHRHAVRPRARVERWRGNVNETLKEGGRSVSTSGSNRLRHVLVASEVALALVVLCGAGLMIKSMTRLLGVDPGLNPKNVLTMDNVGSAGRDLRGSSGAAALLPGSDEHVGAIPGVVSVGAVAHLPFEGNAGRGFQIEGRPPADPGKMPGADYSVACPGLLPDHGHPHPERARVHATGYPERAGSDRHQ